VLSDIPVLVILTNSGDATADYLSDRLRREEIAFTRLDTDLLSDSLEVEYSDLRATLRIAGRRFAPEDISNVWFRRPREIVSSAGNDGAERSHTRAEWAEALEGFLCQVPIEKWMNHPGHNVMASHKIEQLTRASRAGLRIPDTIVTQSSEAFHAFWEKCCGRVVVKPLASGFLERATPEQDTNIYTSQVALEDISLINLLKHCPTLCQQLVDKEADVRVIVVDGDIHSVSLVARESNGTQRLDVRRDNMRDVFYTSVNPPSSVQTALLALIESYKLRFAAIDFGINNAGEWFFFEINPNGQWAWLDLAGASDIATSFIIAFR